jgi:THO complex subunit 2
MIDKGTKSKEQRARNKEQGTKNKEQRTRNKEQGTKSKVSAYLEFRSL